MNKPIGCRVIHHTRKDGEFDNGQKMQMEINFGILKK